MSRFAGKVAIVTGSSNGIGRATAVLLGREGARITITGRNAERLEETRQQILKVGGKSEDVNLVVGDITVSQCQEELVETTIKKFGKIDILVNNAGASCPNGEGKTGIEVPIDVYEKDFKLNVQSVVELMKKCRPYLIASKGDVVNVSSIAAGPQPFVMYTYYGMAKAALDHLTRCSAMELIEHDVRVNSVSPGLVETGFHNAMGIEDQKSEKLRNYFAEHRDCIPVGKTGTSEDIAKLIAFLADRNSSSYIIGQSIVIDGGTSLVVGMATHNPVF